jgi:hypothetical protein
MFCSGKDLFRCFNVPAVARKSEVNQWLVSIQEGKLALWSKLPIPANGPCVRGDRFEAFIDDFPGQQN